jgi:hypothetical protein
MPRLFPSLLRHPWKPQERHATGFTYDAVIDRDMVEGGRRTSCRTMVQSNVDKRCRWEVGAVAVRMFLEHH